MNLRSLCNLAYAVLAENRDADELAQLDGVLAQADNAAISRRYGSKVAQAPPRVPLPGERLLRAVPNNPAALAAMMQQVAMTTQTVQR